MSAAAARGRLGRMALDRGDLEAALDLSLAAVEVGIEMGNVAGFRTPAAVAVIAAVERGGHPPSSVLEALGRACRPGYDVSVEGDLVSEALLALGKTDQALELARRPDAGGRMRQILSGIALARALMSQESPDTVAARAAIEAALDGAEKHRLGRVIASAATEACAVAIAAGDARAALAHGTRALEVSREFVAIPEGQRLVEACDRLAEIAIESTPRLVGLRGWAIEYFKTALIDLLGLGGDLLALAVGQVLP